MYISEKNNTGFRLVIDSEVPQGLMVDYIAMAQVRKEAPSKATATDWNAVAASSTFPGRSEHKPLSNEARKAAADLLLVKQVPMVNPGPVGSTADDVNAKIKATTPKVSDEQVPAADPAPTKSEK